MSASRRLAALAAIVALAGCAQAPVAGAPPRPQEITKDSIGHFCGMSLLEHPGPKGQVFLVGETAPVWFASVREVFAFTLLEEEPKTIAAIYVTDMGRAADWSRPGPGLWVDARKAFYVIGGRPRGGMGEDEAVPFADRARALAFAGETGGRVVGFAEMPRDYVLQHAADPRAGDPAANSHRADPS